MQNKILFLDLIILAIFAPLVGIINPDAIVIIAYLAMAPYLFLKKIKNLILYFGIASLVSLVWILIARNQYGYNFDFIKIFDTSIFPFYAWSLCLIINYDFYLHYQKKLKKNFFVHLLIFSLIYWIVLISAETIAYHVLIIRNAATGMYLGLPICDCIHAPRWMQASYIMMGPIYFSICYLISLKKLV